MRLAEIALVLVCVAAGRLDAQPAAAQAEALFRQGKELMAAGKLAEACAAFEASQKAEPAISTLLNLANCREKHDELATAWGLFVDAERQTRAASDAAGKQLHTTAADRAARLEHRVPHLTITVEADHKVDGLEITRDGVAVDANTWNRAMPIDGGTHVIEARAPGHTPWRTTITVATHDDTKQVEVPALSAVATSEPVGDRAPAPRPRGSRHVGAWVVAGLSLGTAGAAVGFELWARNRYDEALVATDPQTQSSLWHSANTRRYVADGLAVGTIGCAAVAVWLFLRDGDDAHVQPTATLGSAGAAWVGVW